MPKPSQTHRLFIAIEVPDEVRDFVANCQQQIKVSHLVEGSYPKPQDAHLTLKFLGNIESPSIPPLLEALKAIHFDELKLQLTSIGTFPLQGHHPRVIWLGVDGAGLLELVGEIESALSFMSEASENSFHGHLTLMRVKKCEDSTKLIDSLHRVRIPTLQFIARRFVLFESKPTQFGSKYEILAVFPSSEPVAKSQQL